jgi:hypothetical protein
LRGRGAEADEQVRLTGAGVADQAQRVAGSDPGAGGEGVDGGRVDRRVGVEIEVGEHFSRGTGGLHSSDGAAAFPVVALGEQQLGEEPAVGQLLLLPQRQQVR